MKQIDPITLSKAGQPIKILLAADADDDIEFTSDALKESRLANDLESVRDGEELLDYLHQRGDYAHLAGNPQPGLILLDLNMPRMNGPRGAQTDQVAPRVAKDSRCHSHNVQSG